MRRGLTPADLGIPIARDELQRNPTEWLSKIGNYSDRSVDELADKFLAVDGNGVRFAPSIIPGAGLGVVAMTKFPAGTAITRYEGALVENKQLSRLRKLLGADSEAARQLASHTLVLNLAWVVVGNFTLDTPQVAGGDKLASAGLYYNNNPQRQMRGKGLASYMNTLYVRDAVYAPDGPNVAFVPIEDRYLTMGVAPFVARWLERPEHFMMVAVALRDIAADEELFADYGNPEIEKNSPFAKGAFNPEPHQEISWHD